MLTLKTVNEVDKFIERQNRLGNDVRWENYDLVFFRPAEQGIYSTDGAFRSGQWGFENRSPVENDGTWSVDYRNVRRAKRTTRD